MRSSLGHCRPIEQTPRRARQRTHDALKKRAEADAVTGGTCYGYRNQRDVSGFVDRLIGEAEAAIVRQIFRLYSGGDGSLRSPSD